MPRPIHCEPGMPSADYGHLPGRSDSGHRTPACALDRRIAAPEDATELMPRVQHRLASYERFRHRERIGPIRCFADGLEALRVLPRSVSAGSQTAAVVAGLRTASV